MHDGPPARAERTARRAAAEILALLRRRRRLRRPAAPLRHELVELRFVLGVTQPVEEVAELALLLLEPAQGLGPVFVERPVAARARFAPPGGGIARALGTATPAAEAAITCATHSPTPHHEG